MSETEKNIIPSIIGIGAYLPEKRLTNEDLEKLMDTNAQWIIERTGILERRILTEGKGASFLGIKAIENLYTKTGFNAAEIDGIICCSSNPDYKFPATACIIARETGINSGFAFDITAACGGFLFALDIVSAYMKSGKYKQIIVVCAENLSAITDFSDRGTGILFGDAGTAVLLKAMDNNYGVVDVKIKSDPAQAENIIVKGGGSAFPISPETVTNEYTKIRQDGRAVFKSAVNAMADVTNIILSRNELSKEEVKFVIPHQANLRIIEAVAKLLDFPMEKVPVNIHKYGNTSSATIPLVLSELEQHLVPGDKVVITAFGSGYSYGAAYIQWAY